MRHFEKIRYNQYKKDVEENPDNYKEYKLPQRATANSVGYDFYSLKKITIKPQEIIKIPTGYKAHFQKNEALLLVVRSSMGFKYNVRMCNQIGIIDSDYYNNETNEGHIWVALQNQGTKDYTIQKGEAYCQGIFINYLITDDDVSTQKRVGGIGITERTNKNEIIWRISMAWTYR